MGWPRKKTLLEKRTWQGSKRLSANFRDAPKGEIWGKNSLKPGGEKTPQPGLKPGLKGERRRGKSPKKGPLKGGIFAKRGVFKREKTQRGWFPKFSRGGFFKKGGVLRKREKGKLLLVLKESGGGFFEKIFLQKKPFCIEERRKSSAKEGKALCVRSRENGGESDH